MSRPQIMGILNATPDSFSDGGMYTRVDVAKQHITTMLEEGANIIDIGGESTRPGSSPVSETEELQRVIPIIEATIPEFKKATFSIDTTKYEVAKQALGLGASIINDVSGLEKEPRFAELAAEYEASYILMHAQGDPKTMQENPTYVDVVDQVMEFFDKKIKDLTTKGVSKIILDPGIGFGKKLYHNLSLIAHLDKFKKFGFPVLVGASRKSMIGQILDNRPADDRLIGTIAVHYHSLMNGADILRVHDVKEASDSIRIFEAIQSQS